MSGFFGGLNGDGFFNEEFCDGAYEDGECCGSVSLGIPLSRYSITLSNVETEKAVMLSRVFNDGASVSFWMPKACLQGADRVNSWALKTLLINMQEAAKRQH